MIFLELFFTFLKIGIFTFGGGYAMIALIQNEVVTNHAWMTAQEFTDLLAISQMTPGPIGINTATYAGYTAVVNAGWSQPMAVLGSVTASLAVILLPVLLMFCVMRLLERVKGSPLLATVFRVLRITVIGLIASAALTMFTPENFGQPGLNFQFVASVAIFLAVFVAQRRYKVSPILLILLSGAAGLLLYSW